LLNRLNPILKAEFVPHVILDVALLTFSNHIH
jgi:hypothetical protein